MEVSVIFVALNLDAPRGWPAVSGGVCPAVRGSIRGVVNIQVTGIAGFARQNQIRLGVVGFPVLWAQ